MITVTFGNTSDSPFVLNKTFNSVVAIPMAPRGEVNVLNPVFIIKYNSSIISCNYAEINAWGKFYFVKCSIMTDNRMRVELIIDPLKSNEEAIGNLTATIRRTGGIENPTNIVDSLMPIEPNRKRVSVKYFDGVSPHANGNNTGVHLLIHTI